jgi:hypothetical protein
MVLTTHSDQLQALSTYIDGKMKRYSLLFAVNGGTFAIAKYQAETPGIVLGGLTLEHLALGAIAFTVAMAVDIYLFGRMMRSNYLGSLAFGRPGRAILGLLSLLLIGSWALAAFA